MSAAIQLMYEAGQVAVLVALAIACWLPKAVLLQLAQAINPFRRQP